MDKIVPTSWQTQIKIFEKFGCVFKRQKGSHLIFHYPGAKRSIVIPKHDIVGIPIITNNMKTVNMSREEYLKLFNEP